MYSVKWAGLQVADIARLADMATVWKLRAKYAAVRPTGWRSDPSAAVPWRCRALLPSLCLPHCASHRLADAASKQERGRRHSVDKEECEVLIPRSPEPVLSTSNNEQVGQDE